MKLQLRVILAAALTVVGCGGSDGKSDEPAMMPSVVGMNLQGAQDCLQELGFWNLDDQPEAGEPRLQVNDSNWTVTDQSPDPGPVASLDQEITLYARKTGGWGSDGEGSWSCPPAP